MESPGLAFALNKKGAVMSDTAITSLIQEAIDTLSRVTKDLIVGEDEDILIARYQGQYVAPGVSIRQHLAELRASGCLHREGKRIKLKDECNPVKMLAPS